ncbi:hypothetical protein EOS_36790 [Caballeronia mineralivorans PML1(12)]|uniref:Uncharacterized protein n=1 Tax=Caballeronia mineralivorans PML1(12) TaxID=908627 RepID=A0A0J1CLM1_9BURK|nr:hypothetical protein [Caballeronia mineralivorans]KLU21306.1 hypothetical protein EOS_36790 [Caballeronia mineralivorans PML1(12)]
MTDAHLTKDQFFERLGAIGDEMTAAYGKDFAMGALVLAARFIAEKKPDGDNAQSVIYTGDKHGGLRL